MPGQYTATGEHNEWQAEEIKTALTEADDGHFADEEELRKVSGKRRRADG